MYEDSSREMAKVTLRPDVQSISGKVGNLVFKTFTKRDGSKETRVYSLPRKGLGKFGYTRSSKVTVAEVTARNNFKSVSLAIQKLTDEQRAAYAREWKAARYMFNGKKYATFRGYLMARMYDEIRKHKV